MSGHPTLVVGAGPFGLAAAAALAQQGLPYRIVGRPMSFWRENMPTGMILRSRCDWHLDPAGEATIEAYLASQDLRPTEVEPLTLDRYLAYTDWFIAQKNLDIEERLVSRLDRRDDQFAATFENGETIEASSVVVALGLRLFANMPRELLSKLEPRRFSHTVGEPQFDRFEGKRVLIIGGRQSAFESAALIHEVGASAVHICYRHGTPSFEEADWSWFNQKMAETLEDPGWFRRLDEPSRQAVNKRFWAEGRLKLEPWLAPRIDDPSIKLWPNNEVQGCKVNGDESIDVTLTDSSHVTVDHILLATGYKVDLTKIALLKRANFFDELDIEDGYPVLDTALQTTVPGLFMTSVPAARDFGLFFAFTISAPTAGTLIAREIAQAATRR